ncbi:MAG: 30S ribosomal protein S2, partial [Nitriliruptorales bacterium]|nr:30S ribosomal protein S2 [Nitriliruptorales bacterium]
EAMASEGTHALLPKKEVIGLEREHARLIRDLGGIRGMTKLPDAVWIVDTVIEEIAVREANRLKIPVVAILDTNCDPDLVQYPIPGNDDAIRSSALLTRVIADAVADGLRLRASRSPDEELRVQAEKAAAASEATTPGAAAEPKAAWEIELERQQAAEQAAQAGAPTETPAPAGQPVDDQAPTPEPTPEPAASVDAEPAAAADDPVDAEQPA